MSNAAIGSREYGKRAEHARWYHCAICDQVKIENETVVPASPHPQAGLRVCTTGMKCYDELSYDDLTRLNPPKPHPNEEGP